MIDIKQIRSIVEQIEKAQKHVEVTKHQLNRCTLNGHQELIQVSTGGAFFDVTYMDSENGYRSTLKSGCEMILLGVKKVCAERVEVAKDRLADLEAQLISAVRGSNDD